MRLEMILGVSACVCVESAVFTAELLTVDANVVEDVHGPNIINSSNPQAPGDGAVTSLHS